MTINDTTKMTDLEKINLVAQILQDMPESMYAKHTSDPVALAYQAIMEDDHARAIDICTGNWEPRDSSDEGSGHSLVQEQYMAAAMERRRQ